MENKKYLFLMSCSLLCGILTVVFAFTGCGKSASDKPHSGAVVVRYSSSAMNRDTLYLNWSGSLYLSKEINSGQYYLEDGQGKNLVFGIVSFSVVQSDEKQKTE